MYYIFYKNKIIIINIYNILQSTSIHILLKDYLHYYHYNRPLFFNIFNQSNQSAGKMDWRLPSGINSHLVHLL